MARLTKSREKSISQKLPRLIGVIHLPALAGAPGASDFHPSEALARAGLLAVKEAQQLEKAGFDGLIIENFGDAPFFKSQVGPETIASLSVIAAAVRESTKLKLGINVLRNDGHSALAIAAVTGAEFIRVNVLSGVAATDQGLIECESASLLRERIRLGAENVAILGDVQVKHARTLSVDDLELSIEEVALRAGADAFVITGATTGRSPDGSRLEQASITSKKSGVPFYVGSGADVDALPELAQAGARIIVGSALRKGGKAGMPLDARRIQKFMSAYKKTNSSKTKRRQKKRSP